MARQKTTTDLGKKNGKLLIFGGVYSNLQALEALHKVANDNSILPENIICTGDIVGYCAQPEECIELISDWGIHCIAGNVEIQLREMQEDCGCDFNEGSRCDVFSRNWYAYAQKQVSERSIEWMNTLSDFLQFEYAGKRCTVVHGSYFNTSEFIFKSTPWKKKEQNFEATNTDIILGGHCGLPFADELEGKLWLNAGVIGMPANDGDTRVWYLLLDDSGLKQYSFERLSYDNETAAQLMHKYNLPMQYAKTLLTGVWDNCEILPDKETQAQGKDIIL